MKAVLAVVAVALAVTGCSGAAEETVTGDSFVSHAVPTAGGEDVFIAALSATTEIPVQEAHLEKSLVKAGHEICDTWDEGTMSFDQLLLDYVARSAGVISPADVETVIRSATTAFCPEHEGELS